MPIVDSHLLVVRFQIFIVSSSEPLARMSGLVGWNATSFTLPLPDSQQSVHTEFAQIAKQG